MGRVELDPTHPKLSRPSIDRTRKTSAYNKLKSATETPFFYNTLPRSSSIPAALHTLGVPRSATVSSSTKNSPISDKRFWSPQVTPVAKKTFGRFRNVPAIKTDEFYSSSLSSKNRYASISELNIARKSRSTTDSPIVTITPQRRFRKTLASCSNDFEGGGGGGVESSLLRTFNSCSHLNEITNRREYSSTPYDSEDSLCSSISDLSRRDSTSDSDPTPRSSSASPDFDCHDNAFILTSSSIKLLSSPESSPVHKAPGLTTVATNLIEVSRSNGSVGEYRGPSPEGPNQHRKFQNHQGGCTLEHPLINGHSAQRKDDEVEDTTANEVSFY